VVALVERIVPGPRAANQGSGHGRTTSSTDFTDDTDWNAHSTVPIIRSRRKLQKTSVQSVDAVRS
jgi:hypothetical protein